MRAGSPPHRGPGPTPYLIKDRRDLQAIRERKLREHDEFQRSSSDLPRMAYEPRIDYGKKRGLLEEINRAVQDVEHDAAARDALRSAAPRGVEAGRVDLRPAAEPGDPPPVPPPAPPLAPSLAPPPAQR